MGALLFLLCSPDPAALQAQIANVNPQDLQQIDVIEHLGEKIPLDLTFRNEEGKEVELSQFFNQGKPVLLTLVYYECPMLCTLVLNGVTNGVRDLAWVPGNEFQMVSISIDPGETPELARNKKLRYVKSMEKPGAEKGWAFLVGGQSQIDTLAAALGFKYFYVRERDEFAHPAVIFLLGEDGTISRYLYGVEFKERDLRLGLLEASQGKIGSTLDRIILYCYHYDPGSQSYAVFAENLMRLGGLVTLVLLAFLLGSLWLRERMKRKRRVSMQSK